MKIVFVRPLRLSYHISGICQEYELMDTPDFLDVLTQLFRKEIEKPIEEMNPLFLDLMELLLETLSSYGVQLDFFSVLGLEPADECNSLLLKVL